MGRLLGGFGILLALFLIPLSLTPSVIWMVLPGHLLFSCLVCAGALQQGFDGHQNGARLWGALYLVATLGISGAMEWGAAGWQNDYWLVPWGILLVWGWIPAAAILAGAWIAPARRRRLNAMAVRKRKRAVTKARETGSVD